MTSLLEEFASDGVGDEFGVGFAFASFHHLAGEEVDEFFVASFNFFDLFGVVRDCFVDEGVDGGVVGRLEAQLLSLIHI